ncbi:MAG: preprotein translocase subunit SecE [Proteobacteria bacterium]|nr:preprotein translocase subunit SecE [Pseudomonadota bacterium]
MDKNTRNIFAMTMLCVGAIVWYTFKVTTDYAVSYFDLAIRFSWINVVQNIFPVILGGLAAYLLYKTQKIREYILEVISEVRKVVWPNRKETWGATVVVIIAVLISGAVLGIFDWLAGLFMNLILR